MDKVKFKGQLFDVVEREIVQTVAINDSEFKKNISYELVRRGPGVRAIVIKDEKILLNREYRYELGRWDYRLPGGKVFDSYTDYEDAMKNQSVHQIIQNRLADELVEEADIQIVKSELLEVLHCGFTVEWDLHYFLISEYEPLPSFYNDEIQKSEYEYIVHCWVDCSKVLSMCLKGEILEARSAYVLIKYLMSKKRN